LQLNLGVSQTDMHPPKRPGDILRETAGEPEEPLGTRKVAIGTVKYWRDDKGHGVIASDATAPWDIWCHFGQIEDMSGYRAFLPGQRVEVEYVRVNQESFRYRAARARLLPDEGRVG